MIIKRPTNKLEKEYDALKRKDDEESIRIYREKRTLKIKALLPSYISKLDGGVSHVFCLPGVHKKVGVGKRFTEGHEYEVCLKCGSVWSVYDWGGPLVGYINPDKENASMFLDSYAKKEK